MSRPPYFFIVVYLCILYVIPAHATSLLEALKANQVSMSAVKNDNSFFDKGLSLQLRNKTTKTLNLNIDPAMIFEPTDSDQQNLVIIHDEVIVLKAGEEQTIPVQSFCAKAYGGAPETNMTFNYWKQGDETMVKLLRYIVTNKVNTNLAQHAVWVLTDKHSLSNVYTGHENDEAKKLVEYLAGLLHTTPPTMYVYHRINEQPALPAYNPKPLKMMAKFEYIAETDQVLTLGVYNEDGNTIESVFDNKPFGKGGHRFTVEFDAADVPVGKYYIRLLSEGRVLKEEVVKVE